MSILKALWRTFKRALSGKPEPLVAQVPSEVYRDPPLVAHVATNEGHLPDIKLFDALHLIERRAPDANLRHIMDALRDGRLSAWGRQMKFGTQYLVRVPQDIWQDHKYDFIYPDKWHGYGVEVMHSCDKVYSRIIRSVHDWLPFGYEARYYDVYLSTEEIDAVFPATEHLTSLRR